METKKAYQEKIEAQLKEWGINVDILKAKADKTRVEAKIIYYEQIQDLKKKREAAALKLHEIKKGGEGAWGELKTGMGKAFVDLKEAVNRAVSRF
jgi:hypothetical protein